MSELQDMYEMLVREAYPDFVPAAQLSRVERLARGAEYIAKVLHGKLEPDIHVGQTERGSDSHTAFKSREIGWRLRKGRGVVSDPQLGDLDATMAKAAMLTKDGRVLHVTYDPVVAERARDEGAIRAIPAGDVAMMADVVDLLAPDTDLKAVFMFDEHAQRAPYGIQQVTYDLAKLAFRHAVPTGM